MPISLARVRLCLTLRSLGVADAELTFRDGLRVGERF